MSSVTSSALSRETTCPITNTAVRGNPENTTNASTGSNSTIDSTVTTANSASSETQTSRARDPDDASVVLSTLHRTRSSSKTQTRPPTGTGDQPESGNTSNASNLIIDHVTNGSRRENREKHNANSNANSRKRTAPSTATQPKAKRSKTPFKWRQKSVDDVLEIVSKLDDPTILSLLNFIPLELLEAISKAGPFSQRANSIQSDIGVYWTLLENREFEKELQEIRHRLLEAYFGLAIHNRIK
jgi:hypothetical protein